MTVHATGLKADPRPSRLEAATWNRGFDKPTLVLDIDRVAANYRALSVGLGHAHIHYAVKANPHPAILERLVIEGAAFDAASRGEIEMCLAAGARPERISFGNTVKRGSDIAFAHLAGITLYAADCEEELHKIARHAPGAEVYIRLLVTTSAADWPLSRKFGTDTDTALHLMTLAGSLGLRAVGISFHVGSQTRRSEMWAPTLDEMARVWHRALAAGHTLSLLNIGGGFPAFYGEAIEPLDVYGANVMRLVTERFGDVAHVMAEPGRGLVGDAGVIAAEVLTVSRKTAQDLHRWVYLDIGKFSGLAETMDEAIRYQIRTERDGDPLGPCILAGPSCDSADVLYEVRPMQLPLTLRSGDRVLIRNCGAYTSSYSSVGFNGFPPLDVVVL